MNDTALTINPAMGKFQELDFSRYNQKYIEKMISDLREERTLLEEVIRRLARLTGARRLPRTKSAGLAGMRRCRRCGQTKPESEFHRNGRYLMSMCRGCNTARCTEYYRRNRARLNQLRREKRQEKTA